MKSSKLILHNPSTFELDTFPLKVALISKTFLFTKVNFLEASTYSETAGRCVRIREADKASIFNVQIVSVDIGKIPKVKI